MDLAGADAADDVPWSRAWTRRRGGRRWPRPARACRRGRRSRAGRPARPGSRRRRRRPSARRRAPSHRQVTVTCSALAWRSTLTSASWAMRNSSRSCGTGKRLHASSARTVTSSGDALAEPVDEQLERRQEALLLADLGAEVIQRVAHLADDPADVLAELSRRGSPSSLAAALGLHEAIELEGEVGERLADAVVEVAGDPVALLLGADGAQATEPPGVVEGEGGGSTKPSSSSTSRSVKCSATSCSMATRPITAPRAGQHGADARPDGPAQPRAAGGEQVVLADGGRGARAARWSPRGSCSVREPFGEPDARRGGRLATAVGVVEQQEQRRRRSRRGRAAGPSWSRGPRRGRGTPAGSARPGGG